MLPSAIYEPLPFAYMGSGLLLLGVAEQPGLLLAGLAFYLAGSLAWFRRSAHRRIDKSLPARKQGWPLWLYEIRPFALILLGLLMLRLPLTPSSWRQPWSGVCSVVISCCSAITAA